MGIGGENTNSARARFARDVLSFSPRAIIIYYGLNDAAIDVWKDATAPRVSLEQFTENYTHFITIARENNITPILMTPNPCAWSVQQRSLYGKPPYNPDDPEGFNKILFPYVERVRNLAAEHKVPLVDVFQMIQDAAKGPGYSAFLLDGVHPNDQAHALIADSLSQQLQSILAP
jgi:lysophospholipase L1-like esterase